jgi:Domain of unknown function (DUF5666)
MKSIKLQSNARNRNSLLTAAFLVIGNLLTPGHIRAQEPAAPAAAPGGQSSAAPGGGAQKSGSPLGTIKSIAGNSLILTSDAGVDLNVEVRDSTKIVRIAPGQKDLKDAQAIALSDLQTGDRILVRGKAGEGSTFEAASIVAMKKVDIADKQSRERDEWQKSGVGGLVNSVDSSAGVISITVPLLREKKNVAVQVSPRTVLRRYAPGSVKFDDAKPAPLSEVRPGDQLRARGQKNSDGSTLAAAEIVSGSFRNVSGEIASMDAGQGTITVRDLATKKPVTVKITGESQLRKLPAQVAQRIAQRLNGGAPGATADQAAAASAPTSPGAPSAKDAGSPATEQGSAAGGDRRSREGSTREAGARGQGRGLGAGAGGASGGNMDLQQMLSRMPAASIADLQKGDAVMLVGTEGGNSEVTAITLLAGVEPILQGSPNGASSILSPWSLSGAPSGEAGAQ